MHVPRVQYNLHIDFLYHSESFLVGKKARIILHPRLKMEEEPISLKLLQNSEITVTLINNQKIKSELNFKNIELADNGDYVL